MTTITERQRNLYSANCYLCGTEVAPNEGYLYQDTSSKAMRDLKYGSGKKAWKVRCESCQNPIKPPKEPKPITPFVNGFKRAERKSPIVKKAIQVMVDSGALTEGFDASWVDLKNSEADEAVFLTEDKDAVYFVFPSPISTTDVGNVSISAKGVPYAMFPDEEYPVRGERIGGWYGEVHWLFPACPIEQMPDWDEKGLDTGYAVPENTWVIAVENEVHWETLRESLGVLEPGESYVEDGPSSIEAIKEARDWFNAMKNR